MKSYLKKANTDFLRGPPSEIIMSLRQKVKRLMRIHEVSPRKRMGQNFMIDQDVLQLMLSHAAITPSDMVLEIGAGFGFLTHLLAQKSKTVVAVEADTRLMQVLHRELGHLGNVDLIGGDILEVPLPTFNKVVSNPPFSISAPLLFWLLDKAFDCAVLTLQKEFARRLNAGIGSKDYSRLTVSTYYRARIELLDEVPKEAFYPQPDVDATIVRLKPRGAPPFYVKDEKIFNAVLRALFTQRNKKFRNALQSLSHKNEFKHKALSKKTENLCLHQKRVRNFAPEDFGAVANALS